MDSCYLVLPQKQTYFAHFMDKVFEIKNVSKSFKDDLAVIEDVSFDVFEGEIVCVLGESGSGKSTLLRLMGGMEDADTGSIHALDQEVTGPNHNLVPGYDFINYVFQNFRLEPFRTVHTNISSVISYYEEDMLAERVDELLRLCKLTDKADSLPHELSGGQQQRVAIAMALADEPDILLMDEPFSNLDVNLKNQIREEIVEILREAQVTVVLVSHDPVDALSIADRAMILEEGRIVQIDKPHIIYDHPKTAYAAKFLGPMNILTINKKPESIRPEHLQVDPKGKLEGVVKRSTYLGLHHQIQLDTQYSGDPTLIYYHENIPLGTTIRFSKKK